MEVHGLAAIGGAIIGFGASTAPHLIQMLKDRWAHQRYLELKNAELTAQKETFEQFLKAQNDTIAQQAVALAQASSKSDISAPVSQPVPCDDEEVKGHPVMQFLRSSVRPLITYGFFLVFAIIKLVALRSALHNHVSLNDALPLIWDEDTESLFAAVITFWFGSRAVSSPSGSNNGNINRDSKSGEK